MMEIFRKTIKTPVGDVTISCDGGYITSVKFGGGSYDDATPVIEKAVSQLTEYFGGVRKAFDLPLRPEGTDFEKRVWKELMKIPYGETRTYGQIAAAAGNKNASRAVGGANNKNPIAIIIPCHRVIGADGSLTGYAGGLDIKTRLLETEGLFMKGNKCYHEHDRG